MSWQTLGDLPPGELAAARDEAHHGAQIVAAVGETLLPARPDTSQTAMVWSDAAGAVVGHALPGSGVRVGLRFAPLEIVTLGPDDSVTPICPLAGATLDEVSRRVGSHLGLEAPLRFPDYDLPPHPLREGARFRDPSEALAELARWYAGAHAILRGLEPSLREPEPILCWPHHFDIAVLSVLARDDQGSATRTVGIGLSPGDDFVDEPYWYVSHWPADQAPAAPKLPLGEWSRETFTGGLLRGRQVVEVREGQRERIDAFLRAAIEA